MLILSIKDIKIYRLINSFIYIDLINNDFVNYLIINFNFNKSDIIINIKIKNLDLIFRRK